MKKGSTFTFDIKRGFISYRYLKSGIEEFHRKYVLVPADKAANNVVVVSRLHYKAYEQTSEKEKK